MDDPVAEMWEAPADVWPCPSNLLTGGSGGTEQTWEILAVEAHDEVDLQRTGLSVWPNLSDPQADGPAETGELLAPLVGGWPSLPNPSLDDHEWGILVGWKLELELWMALAGGWPGLPGP